MASWLNRSGMFSVPEFYNRGVIKLAPDLLVYVSGTLTDVVIAPVQSQSINSITFNDGITTVSIQNNVDPPGQSTASIEISTPIYGPGSKYWTKINNPDTGRSINVPIFYPMLEVKIYMRGRFLVQGKPKYYPAFWGFINSLEENYSGGVYKISLQCVDMLHWWEYSQVNLHPIPAGNIAAGGGLTMTAYSTIFKNANPFTIMNTLTQSMGMGNFVVPTWVAQSTPLRQIYPPAALRTAAKGIMDYWNTRFQNIGNLLKMYGASGNEVRVVNGNKLVVMKTTPVAVPDDTDSDKKKASKGTIRQSIATDDTYLKNFSVFFDFDKMGDFTDAEYSSKLEIATEIKTRVDYEFFQDVNGNWIFKPPFYNMNTKTLYPYVIKPADIQSCSFGLESSGIVTVLEVQLPLYTAMKEGPVPRKGFHMDLELAARYGIRYKKQNIQYLVKDNKRIGNNVAAAYMSFYNAKCTTGSVTIPGRPELRLGYPVYIEHKDAFYYVKSINHSFDMGGSFSTTLSLEAERRRVRDIVNGAFTDPLKDRIYLYTGPADLEENPFELTETDEKTRQLQESTGLISSMKQGRYKIAQRRLTDPIAMTEDQIPYTDEEGYRHIGGFPYGRGILMSGSTVLDGDHIGSFIRDPSQLTLERQNQMIVGAKPVYEEESEEMSNLIKSMENKTL